MSIGILSSVFEKKAMRLNSICPYFTMFPLDFPLDILKKHSKENDCVIDPFCGRGTTNFAARLLGLNTIGIDASRVAVAATQARLVAPTPEEILDSVQAILISRKKTTKPPKGEFWRMAYHPDVLQDISDIRGALLENSIEKHIAAALRGLILGALHGPTGQVKKSYFSNQCLRTYGPKPAYAVKFWKEHKLSPPRVNVVEIIAERAHRYYGSALPHVRGSALLGDSRNRTTIMRACNMIDKIDWVITSPPYYGLNTYLPDQWIRNWFLGGPETVAYASTGQLSHNSRSIFLNDLREVWENIGARCKPRAKLVTRFGAIRSRLVEDPAQFIASSFDSTGWKTIDIRNADNADRGKRQANTFRQKHSVPCDEVDVWAQWQPK